MLSCHIHDNTTGCTCETIGNIGGAAFASRALIGLLRRKYGVSNPNLDALLATISINMDDITAATGETNPSLDTMTALNNMIDMLEKQL